MEVGLLQYIKYEPLVILVVLYLVFKVPITTFGNFLWFKLTKKKKQSLEELFAEDAMERLKRQREIDSNFEKLQSEINRLNTKISDMKEEIEELKGLLESYGETLDITNRVSLENTLFDDSRSPFRRLKAYLGLLALGANGRIKLKGMQLIIEYKETWLDVQDVTAGQIKITSPEDRQYFDDTLKEINKKIFDMAGKPYAEIDLEKLPVMRGE